MFKIIAPYPGYQTTTILPSPEFSDYKKGVGEIHKKRAMDGTLYTYIKTKQERKRFQWTFIIARNKAIELKQFVKLYFRTPVKIIDHLDDSYIGFILNNPIELTANSRAVNWPGGETYTVTIDFEERE